MQSSMIVGIDVYTDTSERNRKTVTALVASMNSQVEINGHKVSGTKWFSRCQFESREQKYSDWVKLMLIGNLIVH